MKNKYPLSAALAVLVFSGLGCGFLSGGSGTEPTGNSNQSVSDRAINSTIGRSNVGIPECDQVLDAIETELNNPDDNFVVKAAKATALNQIKDSIRLKIEENANKADLANMCREFKTQVDRYRSEEQKNSNSR
jgi:hypothetical protein